MGKREKEQVCPYCGGKSFLGTSEGTMCKACGKIISTFAPVKPEEENKKDK